jgi:hypothetical protein
MRLVQQRPAWAAVPSVRAEQAVKVRAERKPDRAQPQLMDAAVALLLLVVEGVALVLLLVEPSVGTEAVRLPRVLKYRAWRSSTCCWLPALIRIRN